MERVLNPLSQKDKDYVMSIKYDDITKELIEEKFCKHYDFKSKKVIEPEISFQQEFILKKGEYYNDEDVKTNVGQMILNKILYGNCLNIQKLLGYVAKPYDKKLINATEDKIAKGFINKKITAEDYCKYLNNIQWFGNTFNTHVSASFTPKTCKVLPSIKKERDKLFEENKEKLENGDVVTAVEINDKLLDMAKKELKNDTGMMIYDSGCKPTFGNNYGTMFVSRGPAFNPVTGKFDISKKSFADGIDKKDIPSLGNGVINGAFPKAIATSVAGYETKKLFACYQAIKMDKHGSDCGSKLYREVIVTSANKDKLVKRYYLNGNKLELLEADVLAKLIGKKIKIRSPLFCCADSGKICNKCGGEIPYILGIENIGLTSSSVGSGFLNLLMKSFHDSTIKTSSINLDTMIIE